MLKAFASGLATASILVLSVSSNSHAQTLSDQWFIAIGGGQSALTPRADSDGERLERDSEEGDFVSIAIGRDLDQVTSGQLQLFTLGEATFENGEALDYEGAEASLLYRFYDSRDNARRASFGFSIYGRFGIGYLRRETDVDLRNDTPAYFGAGAGLESYVTRNLGLRLEAQYFDTDAAGLALSVVGRFGGYKSRLLSSIQLPGRAPQARPATTPRPQAQQPQSSTRPVPQPVPQAIEPQAPGNISEPDSSLLAPADTVRSNADSTLLAPADSRFDQSGASTRSDNDALESTVSADITASLPTVEIMADEEESTGEPSTQRNPQAIRPQPTTSETLVSSPGDTDGDGVQNGNDKCPDSAVGFPVNRAGCSIFDGRLDGLQFSDDNQQIVSGASGTLDSFARLLSQYPASRIELVAYTDNSGTAEEQAARTRARLRAIGRYLVDGGARIEQLVLRSFGSERPVADNRTAAGRRANNRIEVFERPR